MKTLFTSKNGMGLLFVTVLLPILAGSAFSQNSNPAAKIANAETARAQIIHNAADPAAEVVDIYVNGDLFVDSLAFRAATPFVDVPAGVELTIEIYPYGADPSGDAAFTLEGAQFAAGETYTVIANGVLGDGFAANPEGEATDFNLYVFDGAKESHGESGETSFYVWHGSTDAPAVDVYARDVAQLADELGYTDQTDYIGVPANEYTVDLTAAGNQEVIASFTAPLADAGGEALGVLASGFFTPGDNHDGPAFGLLAVFADGSTVMLPAADLPVVDPDPETARAQIIHNAADPAAEVVDIYVNGDLFVDSLAFRAATPFVDVPAGVELTIEIYPYGAEPSGDAAFTLEGAQFAAGETYTVIANGVLGDGFAANPEGEATDFNLYFIEGSTESADEGEVNFFIWHGGTDVPAVDIWVENGPVLVAGAAYTDYTDVISVDAASYMLQVGLEGSSETGEALFQFMADLSGADGLGAAVLASGFLTPEANDDGAGLALLVVLPDGNALVLDAENVPTSANGLVDRPVAFRLEQNYPNPFNPTTQIEFSIPESAQVTLEVFNIQGQRVATLVDGSREAGNHSVRFDGTSLSSGVYLYRLHAGDIVQVRKMMLVK